MDCFIKYFQCYKNKELFELKNDMDEIKKKIGIQCNPIHETIDRISILDKKIDDTNIDILTKIVYLKEELQNITTKLVGLEQDYNNKDNYCIIGTKMIGTTGTTSDDSDSDGITQESIKV
jgi:hypothetical protein